ncbi:MAG: diaminopimelate decarboxylase [Alphaproteobacteria bacterium]|nr:diaminopimelate decarboxylase [Alphaproteobacteria bacterium]
MSSITYRGGSLHVEQVAVDDIAREVGTPFYCYSAGAIRARYEAFVRAFAGVDASIYYAVKANSNLAVISLLADAGAGVDIVSGGELTRALRAGVPAERIVFAGVGKTRDELSAALHAGIGQFNVESGAELELLAEVATGLGVTAYAGLRVNPDVDAGTHAKITTGTRENKFGVDIARAPELFDRAATLSGIRLESLSMHIGSQLLDLSPYRSAYLRLREMTCMLRGAGHRIDHLDLGGGLGIGYDGTMPAALDAYARIVADTVGDLGCRLGFEPGRFLVGDAGVLVTRVLFTKPGADKWFVIADAAMNDLIRPTLYEARHRVVPVTRADARAPVRRCDLVGPICESGDYIARDCDMAVPDGGDLLAILDAGAYGAVMASTYNTRPLVPEVLVKANRFAVVRRRQTVEEALALERVPDWLADRPGGP